jgi:hypothetical protein
MADTIKRLHDSNRTPSLAYRLPKGRETRWRAATPAGRILFCEILDTPGGYDVRVEYSTGESVYTRGTFELATARQTAAELRELVLAKPGFSEMHHDER